MDVKFGLNILKNSSALKLVEYSLELILKKL